MIYTTHVGGDPANLVQAWRVYQRGLERWLAGLLQPVFDNLISDKAVPRFVQRLRILEFTLDHEAPYFDNMRRRSSRKDSDLNGVVDVRYTGGARMLLQLEVGQGRWRLKVSGIVIFTSASKLQQAGMSDAYAYAMATVSIDLTNILVQVLELCKHLRLLAIQGRDEGSSCICTWLLHVHMGTACAHGYCIHF